MIVFVMRWFERGPRFVSSIFAQRCCRCELRVRCVSFGYVVANRCCAAQPAQLSANVSECMSVRVRVRVLLRMNVSANVVSANGWKAGSFHQLIFSSIDLCGHLIFRPWICVVIRSVPFLVH